MSDDVAAAEPSARVVSSTSIVASTLGRSVAPRAFDYSALEPEKAAAARIAAVRIQGRMQLAAESIIEVGKELIATKKILGHGNFLSWIEIEFGMSSSASDRFMQVAKVYGTKLPTVGNLSPTALYALAAPSTSQDVRDEVEQRLVAGETVTAHEIKELRDKLKTEKQKLKAERERRQEEADRAQANIRVSDHALKQLSTAENSILGLKNQVLALQNELLDYKMGIEPEEELEPDAPIEAAFTDVVEQLPKDAAVQQAEATTAACPAADAAKLVALLRVLQPEQRNRAIAIIEARSKEEFAIALMDAATTPTEDVPAFLTLARPSPALVA